ncbi:MAG: PAS domain S-box protein, partial [Calditrichota bacterium]
MNDALKSKEQLFKELTELRPRLAELERQDTTGSKRSEEEIKNLAKFPDENPDPVFRISKEGVLLYANHAAKLHLGTQIIDGDKITEEWIGIVKNVYDSGKRHQTDVETGGKIFSLNLVPIIEGGYVNFYVRDITAHKRAEEALRESEARFKSAFDNAPYGIALVSLDRQFLQANQAFCDIVGYEEAELVRIDFLSLTHLEDQAL